MRRFTPEAPKDGAPRALHVLQGALEKRYPDLTRHGDWVSHYAALTAKELGLDEQAVERVRLAGALHDVGKAAIDERILLEPGPLSEAQWEDVRRHPQIGCNVLLSSNLDEVALWVLAHHERFDGTGYPHGLASGDIPLASRILAVVDAYDAMRTERVYQPARRHEEAVAELRSCCGTQFDPEVVEAFLRVLEKTTPFRAEPDRVAVGV